MDINKAIEIINKKRLSNSFTMGCSIDEYIKGFRKRYKMVYGVELPDDYVSIANEINNLDKDGHC